jgi:hypothetical protein
MARYTSSVETPRTRREVFAYLSDFSTNCFSYVKQGMRASALTGIAGAVVCGWVRIR